MSESHKVLTSTGKGQVHISLFDEQYIVVTVLYLAKRTEAGGWTDEIRTERWPKAEQKTAWARARQHAAWVESLDDPDWHACSHCGPAASHEDRNCAVA